MTDAASLAKLAIYYGWPSAINGASSLDAASAELARYQVVVLGDGLADPAHGDHVATVHMVPKLTASGVEVFGYVALGNEIEVSAVKRQVKAWARLAVSGVFFDEAGYDFGNTRRRLRKVVKIAHRCGMRVFANAHNPADLYQQQGRDAPIPVREGDLYLYESFALKNGLHEGDDVRQQKMERLEAARLLGVRLFGVSTPRADGRFDADQLAYVLRLAGAHRLDGIGWGEPLYGAAGQLPWRYDSSPSGRCENPG